MSATRYVLRMCVLATALVGVSMFIAACVVVPAAALSADHAQVGAEAARSLEWAPAEVTAPLAPATDETAIEKWFHDVGGLAERRGDDLVEAPAQDIAVLLSYPNLPEKGPLTPKGERLTIFTGRTTYRVGEEVRVLHVHEATKPGVTLYVMGPKQICGETLDGVLVTTPTFRAGGYDGAIVQSPAVDHNYEVTVYKPPPGRHVLRWTTATWDTRDQGDPDLVSNELVVSVIDAPTPVAPPPPPPPRGPAERSTDGKWTMRIERMSLRPPADASSDAALSIVLRVESDDPDVLLADAPELGLAPHGGRLRGPRGADPAVDSAQRTIAYENLAVPAGVDRLDILQVRCKLLHVRAWTNGDGAVSRPGAEGRAGSWRPFRLACAGDATHVRVTGSAYELGWPRPMTDFSDHIGVAWATGAAEVRDAHGDLLVASTARGKDGEATYEYPDGARDIAYPVLVRAHVPQTFDVEDVVFRFEYLSLPSPVR